MSISERIIRQFHARTLMLFNIAGIGGFLLGVKLNDLLFFRPEKYELLRESME